MYLSIVGQQVRMDNTIVYAYHSINSDMLIVQF